MMRCKTFGVVGNDILIVFNVTDNISNIYTSWDENPAFGETPITSTSYSKLSGGNDLQRTQLCPMVDWKYKNNELKVHLKCNKPVSELLKDTDANALKVAWEVEISEPPQPQLYSQVMDLISIGTGDFLVHEKYYEGPCRDLDGTRVCWVKVGAEKIYYN